MSHTTRIGRTLFHHDAALEGMTHMVQPDDGGTKELWVPTEALVEFVAELVRAERIAELEKAGVRSILGLEESGGAGGC